jgi:hypothetical protein
MGSIERYATEVVPRVRELLAESDAAADAEAESGGDGIDRTDGTTDAAATAQAVDAG